MVKTLSCFALALPLCVDLSRSLRIASSGKGDICVFRTLISLLHRNTKKCGIVEAQLDEFGYMREDLPYVGHTLKARVLDPFERHGSYLYE